MATEPHDHHYLVVRDGKGSFRLAIDGRPIHGIKAIHKSISGDAPFQPLILEVYGNIEWLEAIDAPTKDRATARWNEVTGEAL